MDPADPRGAQRAPTQQKTDLEVFLRVRGPELLRQHAANIILGVMIVAAIVVFFYSRGRSKAANAAAIAQRTADAYDLSIQAHDQLIRSPVLTPEFNRARQVSAQNAIQAADQVITSADSTSSQRAIALLAKADVLWALANAPAEALATTQPVPGLDTKDASARLADAEAAYTEILAHYTDFKPAVGNALLGLAAIAENRHDWDKAADWYRRAAEDPSLSSEFHDIAKARQTSLVQLRKPFVIAEPSTRPIEAAAPTPTPTPTPLPSRPMMMLPTPSPAATPTSSPSGFGTFSPTGGAPASQPSLMP